VKHETFESRELATLAKRYREAAGKKRADAARDMEVKQTSIFHAEESADNNSYIKLRTRMIEMYSPFKVMGPQYWLEQK
jgi:DNA-binding XRE family transcriptional regulator